MHNPTYSKLAVFSLLLTVLLLAPGKPAAQVNMNMPYSIYGVGEVHFNQYIQNLGMGGLNQAYRSNVSINDVNPASYAAIDSTSFVFEATMFGHFYEQETTEMKQQSDYVSLGNISFGFPVTQWWRFAGGLKPYSQVGYRIRDIEQHDQAGQINYFYEGSGGINQVFIGSAFEPVNGLSLGFNASYLFGNLDYEATATSDSAGVYQTNLTNTNRVKGWTLGFGAQYHRRISDHRHFTIGATFGHEQEATVNSSDLLMRRLQGETFFDTIADLDREEGTMTLPAHYGFGVHGRLNRTWAGGIDYQWQNWESFRFLDDPENFNNSYRVAAGVRYTPQAETFSTIFHRLEYTVGLRYAQSYLKPHGENLDEFGISFGTIIPIRGSLSAVNINFEYSQRGSTSDHQMLENFYRLNVSVNIYERWFMRRRFL